MCDAETGNGSLVGDKSRLENLTLNICLGERGSDSARGVFARNLKILAANHAGYFDLAGDVLGSLDLFTCRP